MLLLLVMPKMLKSIFIPAAAFRTLVWPMRAVLAVDPAPAPVPTNGSAVGARTELHTIAEGGTGCLIGPQVASYGR